MKSSMYLNSGKNHDISLYDLRSYHSQTYQNYEQPCQGTQNSDFQSLFGVENFQFFFSLEYLNRRPTDINEIF